MGRHEQREQVFLLLFEEPFYAKEEMPKQARLFLEENDQIPNDEMRELVESREGKMREKIQELDKVIDENTTGWDTTRMGKVELAILRLATYEILFDDDIPNSVAIDEAVELAKKYGQESSGAFVNAILAKIVKLGD